MQKFNWNFKDFFKGDEEFEKELEKLEKEIDGFKKDMENLSLAESLKLFYDLGKRCEKLVSYAELNSDLDMSNQKYINFKNLIYAKKSILDVIKDLINKKILLISEPLDIYLEKHPELIEYRMHLYEVLRLKKHNRNDENVANAATMIPKVNDLYNTIQNVELKYKKLVINGEKISINSRGYNKHLLDKDSEVRKKVFNAFLDSLKKVNKSVSSLLNIRLKLCFDVAGLKGYNSIIEQALSEDDLDIEIINNLVKSVNNNIHLLERYFELKKKSLGLKVLNPYDLKFSSSYKRETTFEESLEIVRKALLIMGDEYNSILNQVLESGCLDVFPRKTKFLGGYHWRNYTKPMILMNFNNDFKNTYTVAHELGHAVNGLMIKNKQSFQNFHFSVFLSEIASKVNENILDDYLIRNSTTNEEKKYLLEQKLSNFIDSVFFQTLFLEFEMELCKIIEDNKSLSSDIINDTFYTLYKKYYSSVEKNEKVKYLWQARQHLFYGQYRYYNFQYATGLITALKISNDIINSENNMLSHYLKFLTIGGSKPTLESLISTNVNFNNISTFDEAMAYFNSLLDEYEKILNNESLILKK